jgi:hypothetical protein
MKNSISFPQDLRILSEFREGGDRFGLKTRADERARAAFRFSGKESTYCCHSQRGGRFNAVHTD